MKTLPITFGCLTWAALFISSGNFAFGKDGHPGHSTTSAAAPISRGGARVYSATAPHFTGAPGAQHYSGVPYQRSPRVNLGTGGPRVRNHPARSARLTNNTKIDQPPGIETGKAHERLGNWSHSNGTGKSRLDTQTAARLRDWRGQRNNLAEASQSHREHKHHHHDRDWWRHHCLAIVFFNWGYWAWDAGWWYPAWGYDPYYSYYNYDGPIYGYDGLPPDQVVANAQGALQRLGYYPYAIDGVLGSLTQAALENYQRDHGLAVTCAIDPETLASLGFVQ